MSFRMDARIETEFVESLGLILQNDGLPRIAGRLLGVFVLHGGPFGFPELCERLKVSRGSVSTNTRLLVDLGAIERVGLPGERQDYFRLSEQPYEKLIERWLRRSRNAKKTVDEATLALGRGDAASRGRLRELSHFYSVLAGASETALKELQNKPAAQATPAHTTLIAGE